MMKPSPASLLRSTLLALSFLALSSPSSAMSRCAPFEDGVGRFGEVIDASLTDATGPYLLWECWQIVDDAGQPAESGQWRLMSRHCIEATWAELGLSALTNLGNRLETIRKAADQIAAFHASYARHVTRVSQRCVDIMRSY